MIELIVYMIIVVLVVIWCYHKWQNRHFEKLAVRMPGPPAYPIIGTGYQFIGSSEQIMSKIIDNAKKYNLEPFRIWLGPYFAVVIAKPEDLQIVFNSSKALQKDRMYEFFKNAVGEGLFTAPVEKWRINRRMITPTFNPENFSPENVAKRHKYSFIAFSGGPRSCIGSKYAMLSMKVTLSTFLRYFSVHTDIKLTDIKLKVDLLIRSVHGYPVTIRPRDKRPTCKRNYNHQE
ncbi:PREDICTED: cytochrome P450 4g15-like [Diuraphis noxia]|uniref:cytochrome P450 4g15-like n=1 Tax=Diuraphis noxia TaxID=143948 RepID=UPI000763814A|nr:PREDICTED: cytochrome P450 4g15-like [Diuraphis noxia]